MNRMAVVCMSWGPPGRVSRRYLRRIGPDEYEWDTEGTRFSLSEARALARRFGGTCVLA